MLSEAINTRIILEGEREREHEYPPLLASSMRPPATKICPSLSSKTTSSGCNVGKTYWALANTRSHLCIVGVWWGERREERRGERGEGREGRVSYEYAYI